MIATSSPSSRMYCSSVRSLMSISRDGEASRSFIIGSRLWPLSRADAPKFLHDLTGSGQTLLRDTWDRLAPLAGPDRVAVVTGRAHRAAVERELNADLVNAHGLTINDYEVLHLLAKAPDGVVKPVELASRVLLTPSGITRLLGGLERAGYVARADCAADKRVSYAQLTDAEIALALAAMDRGERQARR